MSMLSQLYLMSGTWKKQPIRSPNSRRPEKLQERAAARSPATATKAPWSSPTCTPQVTPARLKQQRLGLGWQSPNEEREKKIEHHKEDKSNRKIHPASAVIILIFIYASPTILSKKHNRNNSHCNYWPIFHVCPNAKNNQQQNRLRLAILFRCTKKK